MPDNTKYTEFAILERRKTVASLYVRGKTQWEIARQVNASQGTISNDLAAVRKDWLASIAVDYSSKKAEELAKIDYLEAEAWTAWERSCEDVVTVHTETTTGRTRRGKETVTSPDGKVIERPIEIALPDLVKTSRTAKGQSGDPRFLERIAWCIESRLKILGILGESTNVNILNVNSGEVTHEQRLQRLRELIELGKRRKLSLFDANGTGGMGPDEHTGTNGIQG